MFFDGQSLQKVSLRQIFSQRQLNQRPDTFSLHKRLARFSLPVLLARPCCVFHTGLIKLQKPLLTLMKTALPSESPRLHPPLWNSPVLTPQNLFPRAFFPLHLYYTTPWRNCQYLFLKFPKFFVSFRCPGKKSSFSLKNLKILLTLSAELHTIVL